MKTAFGSAIICGMLAATSLDASAAPNLVSNGDFEAGFAGWSATSDFVLSSQLTHSGSLAAATGCAAHACVDTAGAGSYLTQTLATTAGTTYDLSFWVGQDSPPPAEFSVFWNGALVTIQNVSTTSGILAQWTFSNLVASSSATVFELHGRQDAGAIYFDDVSVVPTGTGTGGGTGGDTGGGTGGDTGGGTGGDTGGGTGGDTGGGNGGGTGGDTGGGTGGGGTPVPEPGSIALMGLGMAAFAATRRRAGKPR